MTTDTRSHSDASLDRRDVVFARGRARTAALDGSTRANDADAALDAAESGAARLPGCPRPTNAAFSRAITCDFDGDDRLDWCVSDAPALVAHARADGTCSLDDDAVRYRARAYCPWPTRTLVYPLFATDQSTERNAFDALASRVVCARVWGADAEPTVLRLRSELTLGALAVETLAADPGTRVPVELTYAEQTRLEELARTQVFVRFSARAMVSVDASTVDATDAASDGALTEAGLARPVEDDEPAYRRDGWPWSMPEADRATRDAGADDDDLAREFPSLRERLPTVSAAVRDECGRIERRAARLFFRHLPRINEGAAEPASFERIEFWLHGLARCYGAAGGAWALEATRARNAEPGVLLDVTLRWLGDDGTRASIVLSTDFKVTSCDTFEVEVFGTTDYDDDRRGELVYRIREHWCGDGDGTNDERLRVSTVRGGAIVAFAPLSAPSGLNVSRAEDVDHDGRLDLWDDNFYGRQGCDPAAVNGSLHPVFPVLIHSLSGGRFSYDDALTQRVFRLRCQSLRQDFGVEASERSVPSLETFDGAVFFERAICARAAGWSASRVQHTVAMQFAAESDLPLFYCNAMPVLSGVIARRSPFAGPLRGAFLARP